MKGTIVTVRNEDNPGQFVHLGRYKGKEGAPKPGESQVTWLLPHRPLALDTRTQISVTGMVSSLITAFAFRTGALDKRKY